MESDDHDAGNRRVGPLGAVAVFDRASGGESFSAVGDPRRFQGNALRPRPGSLFVAVDYLTGLGTEVERRDQIRLIEDTDGDGYMLR
jgi:hypothetical protein